MEKKCTKCGEMKDITEFVKTKRTKSGYGAHCNFCQRKISSAYKKTEKSRLSRRRYKQLPVSKAAEKKRMQNKSWAHYTLIGAKSRAKKRGLEFNLVEGGIIIPEVCPLLGIPIICGSGSGKWLDNSPSLDRKDSSKGYTKDNVWVISRRANVLKSNATTDELKALLKALLQHG